MPTARELLEQADALMRRNRSSIADDIPVLTDSVGAIPPARITRGRNATPPAPESADGDTIPTLTQAVDDTPAEAAGTTIVEEGEPSDWLQLGQGEPSAIGEAPDSIAIVPQLAPETVEPLAESIEEIDVTASTAAEDAFDEEITASVPAAPSTELPIEDMSFFEDPADSQIDALDDAPPVDDAAVSVEPEKVVVDTAAEDARWSSMAEEIRMQVLQRIDLFTDTGLREKLGVRLQPIVDRASADLVSTINQHVGELLRAYVAEAIEREIDSWRHGAK
jgi:hypothetical protein